MVSFERCHSRNTCVYSLNVVIVVIRVLIASFLFVLCMFSGVARICCKEGKRWKLCHGELTVHFRAGCSRCLMQGLKIVWDASRPSPSLPPSLFSFFPFPSPSFLFPLPFPSLPLRSRHPLIAARESGEHSSSPAGPGGARPPNAF